MKINLMTVCLFLLLASCAQVPKDSEEELPELSGELAAGQSEDQIIEKYESFKAQLPKNLPKKKLRKKSLKKEIERAPAKSEEGAALQGQIPIENNKHVRKWLNYFKGRGKKHMKKYLSRSTRYIPLMKSILKEHGLPEELVFLAMIESGFSSSAKSSMSAVGFWQFMRGTGRSYGLRADSLIDERRDPVLATHAAAKYLKSLYTLFGSWYLAIASYNVGENKMKSVIMRRHTRNYWDLVRSKALPAETLNYVPKFTAARIIAANPEKHGFKRVKKRPLFRYQKVPIFRPVSLSALAGYLGVRTSVLRELNPAVKTNVVPVERRKSRFLRVPVGMSLKASSVISRAYIRSRGNSKKQYVFYKVKRGENLFRIARRFDTTVGELTKINGIRRKSVVKQGRVLKVPASRLSLRAMKALRGKSKRTQRYRVRRGDTLMNIARKYGVSLHSLRSANKIRPRSILMAGALLKIP